MDAAETGRRGEDMVAAYLKKLGFAVVKRNYRCRYGEIDIIAENAGHIIFTEVKTRREHSLVSGLEAVDRHKVDRLRLTAEDYLYKSGCELQPRFDVAVVTVFKKADGSDGYRLNYMENAF